MKTIISAMPNMAKYYRGRDTVEIGYPWLSYGAIISMEQLLKPEHNVLELGCGGSTIFFSRRCNSVRSYDLNEKWVEKVRIALPNPSNVSFVCGNEEILIESIRKEPDEYYDWFLSDLGGNYEIRYRVMKEAIPKLKKGMYMIVDNYESDPLPSFDYTGWDTYRFDIIGHHEKGTLIGIKL